MSAGLSSKQIYSRTYRRLKGIQRNLLKARVPAKYHDREVFGTVAESSFHVFYRVLRASNGEVAMLPHVNVSFNGAVENFDHLGFKRGIERVRELFAAPATPTGGKEMSMDEFLSRVLDNPALQAKMDDAIAGLRSHASKKGKENSH